MVDRWPAAAEPPIIFEPPCEVGFAASTLFNLSKRHIQF